ncbi:MAG TPA: sigma-70 family RNA polymerase sigma factor [Tepidisphaeraceae bacterium]|jgi:RNA polymerase sigma-70 factor (ECF subfamily)
MALPADADLTPSDDDLFRSAANGDDSAFHALVDRHAPRLFRSALSLAPSRPDAEDLVQETLIGAYRGLRNFDGRSSVKTWLTSILIRQAAKNWQRTKKHRQAQSLNRTVDESKDARLSMASTEERTDRRLDLLAIIRKLAAPHREVLVLREMQGLSYEEIAATLSIPRGTVESRLHRARSELRQYLTMYAPQQR